MRNKESNLLYYCNPGKIGDLIKQEMPIDLKYPNFDELSQAIISKGLALYEHNLSYVKIITTNIYKENENDTQTI